MAALGAVGTSPPEQPPDAGLAWNLKSYTDQVGAFVGWKEAREQTAFVFEQTKHGVQRMHTADYDVFPAMKTLCQ